MIKVTETMGANQLVITVGTSEVFQSYDSIIAIKKIGGIVVLSEHYDYSRTTMKYLKKFLGHDITETRKRISDGEYLIGIDTNGADLL